MDASLTKAIELLHATPARVAISTTGAGGQAIGWLLAISGASNTLLEALVPYAYSSLDEHLTRVDSNTSGGACHSETAKLMAQSSLSRVQDLTKAEGARGQDVSTWSLFGLGCTAAIVSVVPKKGDHRCHVAIASLKQTINYTLKLSKGKRDRIEEDAIVSRLLVLALCEAAGVSEARTLIFPPGALFEDEEICLES